MSNNIGEVGAVEVGAVDAVGAVDISNEFLPSTQEIDFDAEQTHAAAAAAPAAEYLATPSRTPGAPVSATPPAAASGAASSVNALRGATSNNVSTILPLRRGTPYVPVNLSAPASHQRGLFSSSASASALDPAASAAPAVSRPPTLSLTPHRTSRPPKNQNSPRKSNHPNRNRNLGGKRRTLRKQRKQRTLHKQRKQNKGTQRKKTRRHRSRRHN